MLLDQRGVEASRGGGRRGGSPAGAGTYYNNVIVNARPHISPRFAATCNRSCAAEEKRPSEGNSGRVFRVCISMRNIAMTKGIALVLIASFATLATAAAPPLVKFERGTVVISQGIKRVRLITEVANTPPTRALGLMNRTHLDDRAGMLFLFEQSERWSFWMKNTLIPLSVAFIDTTGTIIEIQDMKVAPDPEKGPFEFYQPRKPFQSALEVNQGFFKRQGITVGAKVSFIIWPRRQNSTRP